MDKGEYFFESGKMKSLSAPVVTWWTRTRVCKNAIQMYPKDLPPCVEFYVLWWSWPLELIHRCVFGRDIIN